MANSSLDNDGRSLPDNRDDNSHVAAPPRPTLILGIPRWALITLSGLLVLFAAAVLSDSIILIFVLDRIGRIQTELCTIHRAFCP